MKKIYVKSRQKQTQIG